VVLALPFRGHDLKLDAGLGERSLGQFGNPQPPVAGLSDDEGLFEVLGHHPLGDGFIDNTGIGGAGPKDMLVAFGGDGIGPGFDHHERNLEAFRHFDLSERGRGDALAQDHDHLVTGHQPLEPRGGLLRTGRILEDDFKLLAQHPALGVHKVGAQFDSFLESLARCRRRSRAGSHHPHLDGILSPG